MVARKRLKRTDYEKRIQDRIEEEIERDIARHYRYLAQAEND